MPQLSVGCEAETNEDTARLAPARPSSGVSIATSRPLKWIEELVNHVVSSQEAQ